MIKAKTKVLLLGDSQTGKTSIIKQYTSKSFKENEQTTVGIDFRTKPIKVNGLKMNLQIWDTAGQEIYMSITNNIINNTDGVLIVFDLVNFESLKNIKKWLDYINDKVDNCCKVIVGNKSDLKNPNLDINKIQEIVKEMSTLENLLFFEISAKTNLNINEAFDALFLQIAEKKKKEIKKDEDDNYSIEFDYDNERNEKKTCGC